MDKSLSCGSMGRNRGGRVSGLGGPGLSLAVWYPVLVTTAGVQWSRVCKPTEGCGVWALGWGFASERCAPWRVVFCL